MRPRLSRIRRRLHPGLLLVLAVALLAVVRWQTAEQGPQDTSKRARALVSLQDGWTYRWGMPPLAPDGTRAWTHDARSEDDWRPSIIGAYPVPDRPDRSELWQRRRLPENARGEDASLFLPGVWKVFDAYLDGRLVYHYGDVASDGQLLFPGKSWHAIPLGRDWGGKTLAVRARSDDRYFGIYKVPLLGAERDYLVWMLAADAPWLTLGGLYLVLGLLAACMLTRFREDRTYLAFAFYLIVVGVYDLSRTYMRQIVFDAPMFWDSVELLSAFCIPLPVLYFFEVVFGSGLWHILRRLRHFQVAFVATSALYAAWTLQAPWPFLLFFQPFFVLAATAMIVSSGVRAVRRRNLDATIFAFGYAAAAAAGIHDVLAAIGFVEGEAYVSHLGVALMVFALAVLCTRRFVRAYEAEQGLELARGIQGLLLPKQMQGDFAAFHYQGYCVPHTQVSGDWMQFWTVDGDQTRLMFGDVTGKGPQAAIAMAAVSAIIDRCRRQHMPLEASLKDLDEGLRNLFDGEIGTTVTAISLHSDGQVELYNAGGLGWFHIDQSGLNHHPLPANPLGLGSLGARPAALQFKLLPGDFLFSFTDGILEGTRSIHRLRQALAKADKARLDAGSLFDMTLAVGRGRVLDDDKTMLVLQRRSNVDAVPLKPAG